MNKYKMRLLKERMEDYRWHFWAWMMNHYPRLFRWCNEHLPIDTLPF